MRMRLWVVAMDKEYEGWDETRAMVIRTDTRERARTLAEAEIALLEDGPRGLTVMPVYEEGEEGIVIHAERREGGCYHKERTVV